MLGYFFDPADAGAGGVPGRAARSARRARRGDRRAAGGAGDAGGRRGRCSRWRARQTGTSIGRPQVARAMVAAGHVPRRAARRSTAGSAEGRPAFVDARRPVAGDGHRRRPRRRRPGVAGPSRPDARSTSGSRRWCRGRPRRDRGVSLGPRRRRWCRATRALAARARPADDRRLRLPRRSGARPLTAGHRDAAAARVGAAASRAQPAPAAHDRHRRCARSTSRGVVQGLQRAAARCAFGTVELPRGHTAARFSASTRPPPKCW